MVLVRALGATRTRDLLLRRQLLYPLSYQGSCGGVEVAIELRFLLALLARPSLAHRTFST